MSEVTAADVANFDQFQAWLEDGIRRGWVSMPYCATHDTGPITDEELAEFNDGGDPCIYCIRVNTHD